MLEHPANFDRLLVHGARQDDLIGFADSIATQIDALIRYDLRAAATEAPSVAIG